jgi:hypothetical protein
VARNSVKGVKGNGFRVKKRSTAVSRESKSRERLVSPRVIKI